MVCRPTTRVAPHLIFQTRDPPRFVQDVGQQLRKRHLPDAPARPSEHMACCLHAFRELAVGLVRVCSAHFHAREVGGRQAEKRAFLHVEKRLAVLAACNRAGKRDDAFCLGHTREHRALGYHVGDVVALERGGEVGHACHRAEQDGHVAVAAPAGLVNLLETTRHRLCLAAPRIRHRATGVAHVHNADARPFHVLVVGEFRLVAPRVQGLVGADCSA